MSAQVSGGRGGRLGGGGWQQWAGRETERSTLVRSSQDTAGKRWRGWGVKALAGETHKSQVTQNLGSAVREEMEKRSDEGVKEAITEPVPETDPNGSKEENGEEAEVRKAWCGRSEPHSSQASVGENEILQQRHRVREPRREGEEPAAANRLLLVCQR